MTTILLKKSIFNVRMLLVVAIGFSILLSSLITNGNLAAFIDNYLHGAALNQGTDILSLYTIPFGFSSFVIFAGLFPGIPYAFTYLEERNSGYLNFIKIRMPRKKYAHQKVFFTGLSGGLSMLLPGILLFIVLDIMTGDTTLSQHPVIFEELIWGPWMYIWGGRFVLLLKAILLFLFGVIWSQLALFFSLIVRNKYVAFILPFVVYEMLWIIVGGSIFNPLFLIRFDFSINYSLFTPYIIDLGYIILLVAINLILFRRQGK